MNTVFARACWLSGAVFGFAFGVALAIALSALAVPEKPVPPILDRYVEAYRAGDLPYLMDLFAEDAEENGLRGADLWNAYAETLPVEDYRLYLETVEATRDGIRAEGRFAVRKPEREYRGTVRFVVAERTGGPRIVRVDSTLIRPEDKVTEVITLYSERFRSGDVDGVLSLMAPDARENGLEGEGLRAAYTATLPVSRYDLTVERVDVRDDTAEVRARFLIEREDTEHRGPIRFDLTRGENGWRLAEITYSEEGEGFFDRPLAAYYLYPIPKLGQWWMHRFDGWNPRHTRLANVASGLTIVDAAFSSITIGTGLAVEANPVMAMTGPALPAALAAGDMTVMKMVNDAPGASRPLMLLTYAGVKLGIVLASFLLVF